MTIKPNDTFTLSYQGINNHEMMGEVVKKYIVHSQIGDKWECLLLSSNESITVMNNNYLLKLSEQEILSYKSKNLQPC